MEEINSKKNKKTILVVDDEKPIVDILVYNLKKEGYNTLEAHDGEVALKIAMEEKPDLVLLDIMLPKIDGLTICKKIRHSLNIPIIMLSAKDEEIDKILGLELGADDYITKPFSVRELMARVKANLRKFENQNENINESLEKVEKQAFSEVEIITVGDLVIDLVIYEAKLKGKTIDLTIREFEVLKYLAQNQGKIVTREELLEKVWGYEYFGDKRTVDVTMKRIREKIEVDPTNPKYIITKRGVGYYINSKLSS